MAAICVRRSLADNRPSPGLAAAIEAVDRVYLPLQRGWRISDRRKIALFAAFVTQFPVAWGRCVQQSLICYRLLNGYGIPAKICFGIDREDESGEGHSWVVTADDEAPAFSEIADPNERFKLVYQSEKPAF